MKARIGRPEKPVDLVELEKLGVFQATRLELAAWFKLAPASIETRFASKELYDHQGEKLTFREIFERGQANGRIRLRRKQMQLAEAGNVTMLIWLGKQILGQRDQWAGELTGKDGRPLLDLAAVRAFVASDTAADE